jgi:amidophosphoribosyltransferase
MSTLGELFAPKFLEGGSLTEEIEAKMAEQLGADSLRYLRVDAIARAIGAPPRDLCRACITGEYPTPYGQQLAQVAKENFQNKICSRTYEPAPQR